MIEMLGVLAIIGVLSAGGIMGYSAAMESYKVNKTIEMIAKATSAFSEYFVKRQGSTSYYATQVATPDLCRFNILPQEICNATIVGANTNYRKGYFGEPMIVYVEQSGSGYTTAIARGIVKSDGSGTYSVFGPLTRLSFNWYDDPSKPSRSACIKLLTSPAWQNIGKTNYLAFLNGTTTRYQLPLSMANAESLCVNGMTRATTLIYSEGRVVNN